MRVLEERLVVLMPDRTKLLVRKPVQCRPSQGLQSGKWIRNPLTLKYLVVTVLASFPLICNMIGRFFFPASSRYLSLYNPQSVSLSSSHVRAEHMASAS